MLSWSLKHLASKIDNNIQSALNFEAGMPRVGIFWFYKDKVYSYDKPWREIPPINDIYDIDESHYNFWRRIKKENKDFNLYEYDEIPRGRVLCKVEKGVKVFYVFSSKKLTKDSKFQDEIIAEFSLPRNNTKFKPDFHYEDPSEIDWEE